MNTMALVIQFILYMNFKKTLLVLCLFNFMLVIFLWSRDVTREASYLGFHNKKIRKNMKLGMVFFILSEIMFFFGIFWSLLHSSLCICIDFFNTWPPKGVFIINPFGIPLLNTMLLILSGYTITVSHFSLLKKNFFFSFSHLFLTILLGLLFIIIQFMEYKNSFFCFNNSIYGSCFFISTGFHGLHVLLGLLLLFVCLLRMLNGHFTSDKHVLFECSIWYWHFVDVVWVFLYLLLYCWISF
uniref:Cytochrome c oxidase subunit 3 n=1 Tax=Lissoclinum patella TaxID=13110 RepID=A0A059VEK3_9ASCI|nr:cytochrome c oxidase subunit III [Lissoclinum patella]